ncbi:hypothetical protein BRD08_10320 [Halobacteriales archaeon SW_10_66_29]|nr:MAG: hypothetical protein BRD08_10320 [Halobacteriales archaeon SW_10_66_29]
MDGAIHVVYVDDETGFADLASELLERETDRLSVESVTSADRALDRLDRDVDCVVSDYDMPGTNGLELLEMVRGACPDLPFILFTGKGSEEIASEAISAGVTDYLQKEGGTEQFAVLANRIENAVTKHRAVTALETERDRFSVLFENAPDAIVFYEFDGEEPIARIVNPAFRETFGHDPSEAVGESLDDLVVPPPYADEARSINLGCVRCRYSPANTGNGGTSSTTTSPSRPTGNGSLSNWRRRWKRCSRTFRSCSTPSTRTACSPARRARRSKGSGSNPARQSASRCSTCTTTAPRSSSTASARSTASG